MADMYGAPLGERAWLDDARRGLATGAQVQHTLGEIAMQPDQARLLKVKADLGQMQLREETLWQDLLAKVQGQPPAARGGFTGPPAPDADMAQQENTLWNAAMPQAQPQDPIKRLNNLAELAIGSGLVTKGMKILEETSQIEQRRASQRSSETQASLNAMKMLRDEAENMAQFFGGVKSQQELDMANDLFRFQTGKPSPFANIPYDPEIINSLNQRALSAKERYDLAEKTAHNRALEEHQRLRRGQHDRTANIAEERLKLEREREERLRKQGDARAAAARAPRRVEAKREDVQEAGRIILQDFPKADEINYDGFKSARESIASEAAALLQRNPALSRAQALRQAYTQARQGGDFEFEQGYFGGATGGKFNFTGGGRTPETALPPPKELSSLKKDRYYFNARGQVGRWDGKQMVPVTAQ